MTCERRAFWLVGAVLSCSILGWAQPPVSITEHTVPTASSSPQGIATGPDGALWFAESSSNKIGRVTTGGTFNEYTIPTGGSFPICVAAGPDGALWFTENSGHKIGRITTAGAFTEYAIPTAGSLPIGIAAGPDGALWFTENVVNKIGRITTTGTFTEYSIPTSSSSPYFITSGPDGALWFTENTGNNIGRITTAGAFTEYSIPTATSNSVGIVAGSDGALWFTELNGNKIGRITTAGAFTEYIIPTAGSAPYGIASGSDGALWFAESNGSNIGRITTSGQFSEYSTPTASSGPFDITAGPDGALWFTELSANQIGQAVINGGLPPGAVPVCNPQGFPCVASLTPTNGTGFGTTFTGVFTHSGGATQHYLGYILFLPTPNIVWYTATGSCLVEYNRISNAMRLINDAGTNWLPGIIGLPIGRVGSLTNSHCTLNVGESSATINGTIMTVNAAVTFNPSFTGHLATFMQGFDVTGAYTGMTQFGNWEVYAGTQRPGPYVVDVSPTSGSGSSSTFTFTAGHTSGVSSLSFVTMLISSVIVGGTPCQAFYFQATNVLNLVNDTGTAMVSTNGISPGTAGTLANSRCSIDTGSASANVSGDNVTVSLPMTFDPSTFGGVKNIYLNAFDDFGKLSHWVTSATWTVQ